MATHQALWFGQEHVLFICKQTRDRHLRAAHSFTDYFPLSLIQEKQVVSEWRKITKKKLAQGGLPRTNYPLPHNVKIHDS